MDAAELRLALTERAIVVSGAEHSPRLPLPAAAAAQMRDDLAAEVRHETLPHLTSPYLTLLHLSSPELT